MKFASRHIIVALFVFVGTTFFYGQTTKCLQIVTAEKIRWNGGVSGVTGIRYQIKIKKPDTKTIINFKNLHADGNTLPVEVKDLGNYWEIKAAYTKVEQPLTELIPPTTENLKTEKIDRANWLEYTSVTSKTIQKLNISNFAENKEPLQYE